MVQLLWVFGCRVVLLVLFSVGGGGESAECSVGAVVIVVVSPVLDNDSGFDEVGEVFNVETLVSEPAVERLNVAVLPR